MQTCRTSRRHGDNLRLRTRPTHHPCKMPNFSWIEYAAKWAADTKRDPATIRNEIEQILAGECGGAVWRAGWRKMVNVLEVNLELRNVTGPPIDGLF